MNKIILGVILFLGNTAFADMIPVNSHPLKRCVKLVNTSDYPDMAFTGETDGPRPLASYSIKPDVCLSKGYKANSFHIKAVDKDGKSYISNKVEVYGGYITNFSPLVKEDIEYSVAGFADGKLQVYKSKQVSSYNNGQPDKTETFPKP
jgi:hypothetical protein